jgi:hypothetical protein
VVQHLLQRAQAAGCYKVHALLWQVGPIHLLTLLRWTHRIAQAIVDCKETNVPFYLAMGFALKGACMSQYFEVCSFTPAIPDVVDSNAEVALRCGLAGAEWARKRFAPTPRSRSKPCPRIQLHGLRV